jgi:hypothetical protein
MVTMKIGVIRALFVATACAGCPLPGQGVSLVAEQATIDEGGQVVKLVYRNHGPRTIGAIVIRASSFNHSLSYSEQFGSEDKGVVPGGEYVRRIRKPDEVKSVADAQSMLSEYRVAAVVFDDGSAQGDQHDLDDLEAFRAGEEHQLSRLRSVLRELSASADGEFISQAQRLADRVQAIDVTLEDGTKATGEFANGVRAGNHYVISMLGLALGAARSMRGIANARQDLSRDTARYDATVRVLRQRTLSH